MQSVLNTLLASLPATHPIRRFLQLLVDQVDQNTVEGGVGFDVAFGLGDLGTVTLTGAVNNYSGLMDYEELTVDAGAVLTPQAGQVTVVRARKRITWAGTYNGQNVFAVNSNIQGLVPLGAPSQSGGGGGGGGGDAVGANGDVGQTASVSNGGQAIGYLPAVFGTGGAGGASGAPGIVGGNGTVGTPGAPSAYFQSTVLAQFPSLTGALGGCVPGNNGGNGANGGNGGNPGAGSGTGGAGGNGGNGGAAAGLVLLIAPEIVFPPTNAFNLNGTAGSAAPTGAQPGSPIGGGAAPGASNGGGGAAGAAAAAAAAAVAACS